LHVEYFNTRGVIENKHRFNPLKTPSKDETQTALFKDPVRTAQ